MSADRQRVVYAAQGVHVFQPSDLWYLGKTVTGAELVAASPVDPQVATTVLGPTYSTDLAEYDTAHWNLQQAATSAGLPGQVGYTRTGVPLHTYFLSGNHYVSACVGGQCTDVPITGLPRAIADGSSHTYVATDAGVTRLTVTMASPPHLLAHPPFGAAEVRSVDVGADDDVYVLYDDHLERRDPDGSHADTFVTFGDGQWRWEVLSVPVPPAFTCNGCIRIRVSTLVAQAELRGMLHPWPDLQLACEDCDEEELAKAKADADAYLDELGVEALTVPMVTTFLAKALELTDAEAAWSLDDLLIPDLDG
ncbi:MAG: hypothetical protein R3F59_27375 [Myxococcota bacterium]